MDRSEEKQKREGRNKSRNRYKIAISEERGR